jgi:choline dehydrogenase-like flavoprotein
MKTRSGLQVRRIVDSDSDSSDDSSTMSIASTQSSSTLTGGKIIVSPKLADNIMSDSSYRNVIENHVHRLSDQLLLHIHENMKKGHHSGSIQMTDISNDSYWKTTDQIIHHVMERAQTTLRAQGHKATVSAKSDKVEWRIHLSIFASTFRTLDLAIRFVFFVFFVMFVCIAGARFTRKTNQQPI